MEAPLAYAIARIEKALKQLTSEQRTSAWDLDSSRLARALEKSWGWAFPHADEQDWFVFATMVQEHYEKES